MLKMRQGIKLAFILCLILAIATAIASAAEDDWEYSGDAMLYLGDTYSVRGCIVEVIDFDKENGMVLLELKKDGELLDKPVLNASCDEYIYGEDVKINIYNTTDDPLSINPTKWKNPCIHVEFFVWKKPTLSMDVTIKRITYKPPDSDIHVTVEVENNGEAEIRDVDLYIDPDGLSVTYGRLTYHFSSITEDESESIDLKLKVPMLITNSTFTISANVSGVDTEDVAYTAKDSETLEVLPVCDLKIQKIITNTSMNGNAFVRIDVENTGVIDLNLTFMDAVPPDFKLCQDTISPNIKIDQHKLFWSANLAPHEKKNYYYYMEPLRPGVFSISPATAEWNIHGINYTVSSNAPVMAVDGAYLILNKIAFPSQVKCGEYVTVSLSVVNIGNKAASVTINDVLPDGTSLVSGNTTLQTMLDANQTAVIEYIIKMEASGNITFPHSEIELVSKDYSRLQVSDVINIEVSQGEMTVTSTPDPQPTTNSGNPGQELPKFEIALVVSLLALAYYTNRYGRA